MSRADRRHITRGAHELDRYTGCLPAALFGVVFWIGLITLVRYLL